MAQRKAMVHVLLRMPPSMKRHIQQEAKKYRDTWSGRARYLLQLGLERAWGDEHRKETRT